MKKGTELGIRPIKCENKSGTDKLKAIHFRINEILYNNAGKWIDPTLANAIYTDLCALGVELDELDVPETARPKKKELLGKLRPICVTLKDYRKLPLTPNDLPQMQAALNFFIHLFIEAKKNDNIKPEEVLAMLVESRRLWDAFCPFEQHLKTDHFIKANGELLRWFESKYSIRELD